MSEKEKDKKKKKIWKIIAGIVGAATLIGGATVIGIIVASKQTPNQPPIPKQKINLNTKIKVLWPDVFFDANKINQELDLIILSDIHLKSWLQPNLVNPEIKYFRDAKGKIDVSNQKQQAGYLYVIITANINDENYQGSTVPIKIPLKQYKLSDITQLSGLNLTADSNKRFKDFDDEIRKAPEFKINPLKNQYSTIYYFESESDNWPTILNEMKQRKGTFWIIINVTPLEPNWYGETPKIEITIN